MKLYLISQDVNSGWDTFDSAIVAAHSEEEAKAILPHTYADNGSWAPPQHVKVEYIGTAKRGTKAGPILASFNAG